MRLTLKRAPIQPAAYCTLGLLQLGTRTWYTVELPWVAGPEGSVCGHQGTSRIGPGEYTLTPRETEARGYHWRVSNPALGVYPEPADIPKGVYGRSLVLIHAANWAHELLGCIAPGKDKSVIGTEWGVTQSRVAMLELRIAIGHEPGVLTLEIE